MAKLAPVRLAEVRVIYLDQCRARAYSRSTIHVYDGTLQRLIRDVGNLQMQNITNAHIENWLYGLRAEHRTEQHGRTTNPGVSPATFNQQLSVLRTFFKWAQGQGYLRHNPTVNLHMIKVQKKVRLQAKAHELLRMLEVTGYPRDRAYIALAINTALRQNELLRIRWGDVDLEGGTISVVISKTGDADEQPISADLDNELRRWMKAYQDDIKRPIEDDDYVIPTCISPRIQTRNAWELVYGPRELRPKSPAQRMEKVVQAALGAIGLNTFYEGTHTIRRSVARAYFDTAASQGGDVAALRETAQLLHHSNLHTTERYLGTTSEKEARNRRLKGKPFLTAMVDSSNVVAFAAHAKAASGG